ncbi:MAG TPA: N,N-dimethylformamidase beta subunit family domain-containing protein [Nitrospira sp.]|nr:N,N-dimethylformamidase beta subunit family domain-containing protein [Nitrospira sp.]
MKISRPAEVVVVPHAAGLAALVLGLVAFSPASFANPVSLENLRGGTTGWQLTRPAVHHEIEGYASAVSIERGESLDLFVSTANTAYRLDVYRMGWYGGAGARLVSGGIVRPGRLQPSPHFDPATGLIECRWQDPYRLHTRDESEWLSGLYLVKLTGIPDGFQSYIIFVVREDRRRSDLLFQSSVTTYQAYNNWGGKSLYDFNSEGGRARKVSFNRPYAPSANPAAASGVGAGEFLANLSVPPHDPSPPAGWEYNMVRWLEREGYDVTYGTNLDSHGGGPRLSGHRAWLSVGHDEYWTWEARAHIEEARRGMSLLFFSANVCYWQIRLEPSALTGAPDRTIVAYKDTALSEDPYATDGNPGNDHLITGRWRDAPLNNPEERLVGVMYDGGPVDRDLIVTNPSHWVFAETHLETGDRLPRLLGYEADRWFGLVPRSTEVLAESLYWYEGGLHVADMALYETTEGRFVFAAGTIQWSWGLDDFGVPAWRSSRLNQAAQQITRNILSRSIEATVLP